MFDTIGVVDDPEGHRRKALSSVLTGLLIGLTTAGVLAVGAVQVAPLVPLAPRPTELLLVYVEVEDELDQAALPEAPPVNQPTKRAGTPEVDHTSDAAVAVQDRLDDVPEDAGELNEAPELATPAFVMLDSVPTRAGGGGGPSGLIKAGIGTIGSTHTTTLADVTTINRTNLYVRRRVKPTYPASDSRTVTCKAVVRIGADGKPTLVRVGSCPKPFANATRTAIRQWRWRRPMVNGSNQTVESSYDILFLPEER